MNTNLHLVFPGTCHEAFSFYEEVFDTKRTFSMKFGDAPHPTPVPAGAAELIMHTSMPLGSITLMGCDAPPGQEAALGGFHISIDMPDEAKVNRIFTELSAGGTVTMRPGPTFWTPLFSMFTDRFGVGWMVSVPGPEV